MINVSFKPGRSLVTTAFVFGFPILSTYCNKHKMAGSFVPHPFIIPFENWHTHYGPFGPYRSPEYRCGNPKCTAAPCRDKV